MRRSHSQCPRYRLRLLLLLQKEPCVLRMEVLKLFAVFEEMLGRENTILIPEHVESACVMERWGRSGSSTTSRLSWSPFALDFFVALVTGCSTIALVAIIITVSLLAAVSEACCTSSMPSVSS